MHLILKTFAGLQDGNRLLSLLDGALPGINGPHPRQHIDAGDQPVTDQPLPDRQGDVHIGKGRIDEKWAIHAMPFLRSDRTQ